MLILTLVLKVYLDMFRERLEIPVIPYKAHLINQDKGIRRELVAAESFCRKDDRTRDFPITVYVPAFFLILQTKLSHQSSLAGTLLTKTHIKLIRVTVFPGMISNESNNATSDYK